MSISVCVSLKGTSELGWSFLKASKAIFIPTERFADGQTVKKNIKAHAPLWINR